MDPLGHILQQYDNIMSGDAWYGDPVWNILEDIDAQCATAHPVAGAHSIWQLVMHMKFWEEVAVHRASAPVTPNPELNFPKTPELDGELWRKTLAEFRNSNREFREALMRVDPTKLDEKTPGGQRSFRCELTGVIQHHIYHAGQIALLKKAYTGRDGGRL
jgi:uncharacterized damage-inducible protein DinB